MSMTEDRSSDAGGRASVDEKLEVVVIPVSDAERAKEFYGRLGWRLDADRLTGAYALGPEAGEWLQQATLAIRADALLEVLGDTIQPFPSFSGIYDTALTAGSSLSPDEHTTLDGGQAGATSRRGPARQSTDPCADVRGIRPVARVYLA